MLSSDTPIVCHYDIMYDNMLFYPENLKSLFLVDFEDTNWGPEGLDLGAALEEFVFDKSPYFKGELRIDIHEDLLLTDA